MAMNNMLTLTMFLDAQPGGVKPELHLKEDCSSVHVEFLILHSENLSGADGKDCIIKGIRPDGTEVFLRSFTGNSNGKISAHFYQGDVRNLASAAGTYECTLSICNTTSHPTRNNYMNYDFITVLPFTVIVQEKARRDADA